MKFIQEIQKNEKKLIEGFFVSLTGGFVISAVLRGTFKKFYDIGWVGEQNFLYVLATVVIASVIMGVIYSSNEVWARAIMFEMVLLFAFLCAYKGSKYDWEEFANNPIGNACYCAVLCFITVLSFLYVKKDLFFLLGEIRLTKKRLYIISAVISVGIFVLSGVTLFFRYSSYSNTTFDFGIFSQMFEYMRQKGTMDTTLERNYLLSHFAVHCSPVFYLILPIYFVFPFPMTLELFQALMVALPIIPIIILARHYKLSEWKTLAFVLLYALYPATVGGTLYDIHENCFLTFFILMAIWAIEKKKNIVLAVFVILTFLVKEDAAIYMLVIGAYLLFSRKDKKRGVVLMIVSALYFVIAVKIVNSFGLGVLDDRFGNLYYTEEGGLFQIVQTIITNPAYAISQIVASNPLASMDKIEYLMQMLIPVGAIIFMTGKKYSRYILFAPFIMLNAITTYKYLHSVSFQYNFGVIALFFYVMIMNVSEMSSGKAKKKLGICLICATIFFAGTSVSKLTLFAGDYFKDRITFEKLDKAMSEVPKDASVSASRFFTPHLSKNLKLYDQSFFEGDYATDYLVVDMRTKEETELFDSILEKEKYDCIYEEKNIVRIYKNAKLNK